MTNEERQLLLQDLCARLPYGVFAEVGTEYDFENGITDLVKVELVNYSEESVWGTQSRNQCFWYDLDTYQVKPYLRSMEDMTDEEKKEFAEAASADVYESAYMEFVDRVRPEWIIQGFDYLNKNHFDYRGLIDKNIAIRVIKDNNPYKTK